MSIMNVGRVVASQDWGKGTNNIRKFAFEDSPEQAPFEEEVGGRQSFKYS
jgi:hypothetical protein